MKVSCVIQRNGFKEDHNTAILMREPDAFTQHSGRVGGVGRTCDNDTGNIGKDSDAVIIVEMPSKALLIGQASDAHDHRVAILTV